MANITPFEQAKRDLYAGKISAPNVTYKGKSVPYFRYQLSVHIYHLKIMSIGLAVRGLKLNDLKKYYGLKGRSAKDCLPQLEQIMAEYEKEISNLN